MCVILLWPSKIKSSLILMQNVFNVCTLRTNWLKILILEDLDWIQVFLKNFSSHTHAFFFIKQCALKSFCIKMLCFSKIWFFKTFDRSNLFFFMHHLCLGFTCIALFLYPSCNFAIISLIVFTHNMHTLYYIGYSTWSKNWLINFWAMYFLVYALFMCEL